MGSGINNLERGSNNGINDRGQNRRVGGNDTASHQTEGKRGQSKGRQEQDAFGN